MAALFFERISPLNSLALTVWMAPIIYLVLKYRDFVAHYRQTVNILNYFYAKRGNPSQASMNQLYFIWSTTSFDRNY